MFSYKKSYLFIIFSLFFSNIIESKQTIKNLTVSSKKSEKILQRILADHGILLFQTLNYHWNLEGKEFHDYHILFDNQYKQLFAELDLIAERIRAIGGQALGSMKAFINFSDLREDVNGIPVPQQMVQNLLTQYEKIIQNIKNSINVLEKKSDDFGTRKMLEDLLERDEKTAWMLRSLTK